MCVCKRTGLHAFLFVLLLCTGPLRHSRPDIDQTYCYKSLEKEIPQLPLANLSDNSFWNDKYPWASASLDGWLTDQDGLKGILEIKTTNILQSMQKEKWDHRIPDNYYCQVLWYMGVTGFDFAILKAQLKYDYDGDVFLTTKHYQIERSEVEEDINYLMQRGEAFAEYIKKGKEPPLVINI